MSGLYERLFRHVLYPAYETGLRRRHTLRWLAEYERDQWQSPEAIAALQWQRLQRLLEHCFKNVPYYRDQWRALGITPQDIRCPADYARLPVLTKQDITTHFQMLKADGWHDRLLYKATGGSTGVPLRFGYTRESNERRSAVMWRGYGWAGARMGRRSLYLWGGALGEVSRGQQLKERLYHAAFGRRMLNTFALSEATLAGFADAIDAYRPQVIVGYVGPLVRLSQWLLEQRRKPFRPQAILGGAEALHGFQRELIEQAFGAPTFNTYGCREFMLMASECEHRDGLHINADHLRVDLEQPLDHPDGAQSGAVLITDLFNYGMPFIRYRNGDLATTEPAARCACGRGLPRLRKVEGRQLDAIRSASGHLLPGEFFPHLFKDIAGVQGFQIVQRRLDALEINVVRGENFNDASRDYVGREVAKVLGDGMDLRWHFVEQIAPTRSGKARVTVSALESLEPLDTAP